MTQFGVPGRAWAQLGLWSKEMQAWIAAVGMGAAIARGCLTAGVPLSAMDLVLDGVHVKQCLTGGETVFSVLPHAASSGGALSK
ncbi:hypothetical protein [Streptomyces sp. NPDC001307]|uniref:hypothetical protein n=1 Tax=Streptomyces sp. NPDC001307 TaxID=3364560 RepID=UPI0036A53450